MTIKRIVSKVTLMGIVGTLVLTCFITLGWISYNAYRVEYESIASAYNDIKHSSLKDQIKITMLENTVAENQSTINELVTQVEKLGAIRYKNREFIVEASAYTASSDETDSTPNQTAFMEQVIPGKTCAVSRDLRKLAGKHIYVENVGKFYVNDLMNKRYRSSIDIAMHTKKEARQFGRKEVRIVLLD